MDKATRAALSQLAARQQGLFSVTQAKQIGVSNAQLLRAEAAGLLRRAAAAFMPPPAYHPRDRKASSGRH